ncbi:MAG TPA: cytochrome c biogenesis protein ResB, partial [Candidatus Deferrimicrobium sp.]|nr:cytochrome c biogenesis protein ResB [Candidatus Deferrimicrobium sp.]
MWRLFTSVDFAVFQIIFLALLAVVGMTIKQLPDFAYRSATDYAQAIEGAHARYDPVLGAGIVDVMVRLSLFSVFRSPWFSAGLVILVISIVVCTLDRTPRLWRGVSDI